MKPARENVPFGIILAVAILSAASSSMAQNGAPKKWTPPRIADGHPDLQGTWSNATIIPLERAKELAGKQTFTEQEYIEYQNKVFARADRDRPGQTGVGTYNAFWWDQETKLAANRHTSLIIDPADGRVPPLTAAALKRAEQQRIWAKQHPADGPEDRPLMDRCLNFPTAGPPMLPSFYNGSPYGPLTEIYQIVQTHGNLAILVEHNHETRVIPIDGQPHLPPTVRLWLGDSRGHWEGDTLVIDTTNFSDKTSFKGSDENLHLTERLTRTGPTTLTYRFIVDDPTAFTSVWTGEYPFILSKDTLFEYACHEGNYGLAGVLAGARADEKNPRQ